MYTYTLYKKLILGGYLPPYISLTISSILALMGISKGYKNLKLLGLLQTSATHLARSRILQRKKLLLTYIYINISKNITYIVWLTQHQREQSECKERRHPRQLPVPSSQPCLVQLVCRYLANHNHNHNKIKTTHTYTHRSVKSFNFFSVR